MPCWASSNYHICFGGMAGWVSIRLSVRPSFWVVVVCPILCVFSYVLILVTLRVCFIFEHFLSLSPSLSLFVKPLLTKCVASLLCPLLTTSSRQYLLQLCGFWHWFKIYQDITTSELFAAACPPELLWQRLLLLLLLLL